ncbi:sigma factor-like helix-turn-helix DNA-binding protein [Streptomyces sp. NPDC004244]
MLGSFAEAEDAVQETWLRLNRTGVDGIENLGGWLTTVTARICLNMLRTRETRREEPLDAGTGTRIGTGDGVRVPDPVVSDPRGLDPEQQVLLADSVGLALLVVLESLSPAERVAFVLHDMFAVPFDEIAPLIERTSAATRQLASRARRRVQGQAPSPDPDPIRQREVVDAFFAASRDGAFDALVAVLHPDVVLRSDGGPKRAGQTVVLNGAHTVASQAATYRRMAPFVRPALINGAAGAVVAANGIPLSVMAFAVSDGLIVAIDVIVDPDRLRTLDLSAALG